LTTLTTNDSNAGSIYSLPADLDLLKLEERLQERFELRRRSPARRSLDFYDSFEWTLWHRGELLCRDGSQLGLFTRSGGWLQDVRSSMPYPRKAADLRDPNDLPSHPLADTLQKRLGLRGLLKLCSFQESRQEIELLDDSRKVVFRLDWIDLRSSEGKRNYTLCDLRPLRGYEQSAETALQLLLESGLAPIDHSPLEQELETRGTPPRVYSLKPSFDLQPDLPAREAVCLILQRMLELARENEVGVLEDIDTEFLHDYRVCLRKMRSIISLVKGVFPEAQTEKVKRTLAALASRTNRLRDLDVYLLEQEKLLETLPESLRPGLAHMFDDFRREREKELRAVRRHLQSASTAKHLAWLEHFLSSASTLTESANSKAPIAALVFARTHKRYKRIRRIAADMHADTPDEEIHELRIHCKKLRYMLEFFAELLPSEQLPPRLKALKKLQGGLGTFNDSSVQQISLLEYVEKSHKRERADQDLPLSLSIGALLGILYQRQQAQRDRIFADLAEFGSEESAAAFKTLFQNPS